jgi:predicted metalloendopeptidase
MPALRTSSLVFLFAATLFLQPQTARVANVSDMDRAIKPGDDFYRYANGGWLRSARIPDGATAYDTRALLTERTRLRVRDLILEAAAETHEAGSVAGKVGDYYASLMDKDGIDAKGLAPLQPEIAAIEAITDATKLSAYLGTTLNSDIDGLTANSDHVFGEWVNQGFEDATRNRVHLGQGGLALNRDAYLDQAPAMSAIRETYQRHIAAVLARAGATSPEARAARVLSLECRIAQAHAPDADAADAFKQNNTWRREDFDQRAPGMDWRAYFKAAALDDQPDFIVWQPSAVTGVAALVASESLDVWKDYLRFHLLEQYAAALPQGAAVGDRETPAIAATNAALGQAVGELYTRRFFPAAAKIRAKAMVTDLVAAYRVRLSGLEWMSPSTKQKALAKLAALNVDVGYPDAWIDYSKLSVVRGDAVGNMRRAAAFQRARNRARLHQPADPHEWRIDPQMVAAVILFSPNTETFAATLLQPPYFDPDGDAASNYGSAGAGIAHEITHSFDELGNIYDEQGRLGRWWTDQDIARYHAATAKLAAQLDRDCPLQGVCVKGAQVLPEAVADVAGLQVAHDAYVMSLKGRDDVVIDGLTGEQRFFLAFAQRWRRAQSEAALRRQIATDTHPLAEYRSDAVRNVGAWYDAFHVAPGNRLYLKPADRVSIW